VVQPECLEYVLLEKEAETKQQQRELKELLPFLKSLKNRFSPLPKVRYYEGIEGLKRLVDYTCEKDEEILFMSGHNEMHPQLRKYIERVYVPTVRQHIKKHRMIINDGEKSRAFCKKSEGTCEEIIFIDPKEHPFKLTTFVHGNRVAFASYNPKDLTGIVIENQFIADHMREVYKILEKYFKGKK